MASDPLDRFVTSDLTVDVIAEEFKGVKGCSHSSLTKRSTREGWLYLRHEYKRRIRKGEGEIASLIAIHARVKKVKTKTVREVVRQVAAATIEKSSEVAISRVGERIAQFYEQLLQTAMLINGEATKLLMADRIKLSVLADGSAEIEAMDINDKLRAAQMHSIAVATLRNLSPNGLQDVTPKEPLTITVRTWDRQGVEVVRQLQGSNE